MPRYTIIGYEEFPALHLHPTDEDRGVALPAPLYSRWLRVRAELDAVQRDVVAHLRACGGRGAIPEELWEAQDRTVSVESEGERVHGYGRLPARL